MTAEDTIERYATARYVVKEAHEARWARRIAVFFLLLFRPMIRTNRTARFFGLGALFALVPACSTLAQTRQLMFAGIGAFGLLALWLTNRPRDSAWPRTMKAGFLFLVTLHLVIAPLLLAAISLYPLVVKWI